MIKANLFSERNCICFIITSNGRKKNPRNHKSRPPPRSYCPPTRLPSKCNQCKWMDVVTVVVQYHVSVIIIMVHRAPSLFPMDISTQNRVRCFVITSDSLYVLIESVYWTINHSIRWYVCVVFFLSSCRMGIVRMVVICLHLNSVLCVCALHSYICAIERRA